MTDSPFRSHRSQMFFKLGALKNVANFTGKHWCWSLFLIKFQASNFIRKILKRKCFPVKFAKFLRTPFFTEHLWLLLLNFRFRLNYFFTIDGDFNIWGTKYFPKAAIEECSVKSSDSENFWKIHKKVSMAKSPYSKFATEKVHCHGFFSVNFPNIFTTAFLQST